jgi:amino acid adenylation domain-containing protein
VTRPVTLAAVALLALHYIDHVEQCAVLVCTGANPADSRVLAATIDPDESFEALAARLDAGEAGRTSTITPDCLLVVGPLASRRTTDTGYRYAIKVNPATGEMAVRGVDAIAQDALFHLFRLLLDQVRTDPTRRVADFQLMEETARKRVLIDFNATDVPLPADLTLPDLLTAQAGLHPDRIAVTMAGASLTYRRLLERAERLSGFLVAREPGPHRLVGVLTDRSLDLPVALFGILGAGLAYLPLDGNAPKARLRDLIVRCGVTTVLADPGKAVPAGLPAEVFPLDDEGLYAHPAGSWARRPEPGDLCYVIHTSGSTGHPKGVMVEHRSVINRLTWMQRRFPLGIDDVVLHKTPTIFDVSVWELFWWVLAGARMHLLQPGAERFPLTIEHETQRHGVTVMHFVPSMLNVFLAHLARAVPSDRSAASTPLAGLRRVFASGESLLPATAAAFQDLLGPSGCRLVNLYGPTETTVDVTCHECPAGLLPARIPIGRPIDNTRVYVLRHGQPVPVGVYGTLFVAGVGVARGYLGDRARTAERFVPEYERPSEIMYRTGDICRWTPDGELEYLGRDDLQVKIRGIRVELEEIEHALLGLPGVTGCAVRVDLADSALAVLRAAVTGTGLTAAGLRGALAELLPGHLIPASFDLVGQLPCTPSGKVDRALLADPRFLSVHGARL